MSATGGWDDDDTPVESPHGRARASERPTDQWSFTAPFEGVVPHLYKDSRGNVTCGVGFLVTDEQSLGRYPWSPNTQAATADYRLVKAEPFERKGTDGKTRPQPAVHYMQLCKARLSELGMRAVFAVKVAEMQRAIAQDWKLAQCPEAARIALIDMAFNLGPRGLNEFAKLHRAVINGDWETAAKECARGGVQPARNEATAFLFRTLLAPQP